MTAVILDGASLAKRLMAELARRVGPLTKKRGRAPCLAVLSIGTNSAAKSYTRSQIRGCKDAGIDARVKDLPANVSEDEAVKCVQTLGLESTVDGILLETPLPVQVRLSRLLEVLTPAKDIEGLTPVNYGRLFAAKNIREINGAGLPIPPTARAVIELLGEYGISPRGREAVVLGRSSVVGRPLAHLLSCLDATVTVCHSQTPNLEEHLHRADIVISAIGQPRTIKASQLKPGSTVVDAGICYEEGKVCGDVDFVNAKNVAGYITPVPGGVGPVTTAMLLGNVLAAAERSLSSP